MINGAGDSDGRRPPGGGGEEDEGPMARAAEAMADADDESLLGLAATILAELKDRDLLRVLLRNRVDAGTLFEVEEVRGGGIDGGLELVAAGYHAETPDGYDGWVMEAEALHARLGAPGLSEDEAEATLGRASDEALLLELDRAREEEEDPDDSDEEEDSSATGIGPRVAIELLRRGVIEASDEG
jgi:hypothetical protein